MYENIPFRSFRKKLLENEEKEWCPHCGRDMGPGYYCDKCDYPTKDRPSKPMSANQKRRAAAEAKKAAKNN